MRVRPRLLPSTSDSLGLSTREPATCSAVARGDDFRDGRRIHHGASTSASTWVGDVLSVVSFLRGHVASVLADRPLRSTGKSLAGCGKKMDVGR